MSKLTDAKQSAFKKLLAFMRKSKVNRFLVGYGAFFGLGLVIYLSIIGLIIPTYYAFAPPRSFVDYYYARVADTPVGTEPQLTLCRKINYDNVKISAVRTFIYHTDADNKETVGEYSFDANVSQAESTGNCVNVRLKGQPMTAGTYSTSTSIEFFVGGHRKTYSYNSNQYKMIEVETTDEEKIQQLQKQIDEINDKSGQSGSTTAPRVDPTPAAPQSAAPVQDQPIAAAPSNPTPAPTEPTTPAPQPDNSILGRVNQLLRGIGL